MQNKITDQYKTCKNAALTFLKNSSIIRAKRVTLAAFKVISIDTGHSLVGSDLDKQELNINSLSLSFLGAQWASGEGDRLVALCVLS